MKKLSLLLLVSATAFAEDPALTIYNGGFAVVRETLPLDLKAGINQISFAGATAKVEADTVILRDVAGRASFRILEQSYRNDAVTLASQLARNVGKNIEFIRRGNNGDPDRIIVGKVIRAGNESNPYVYGESGREYSIFEINGRLQFYMPGDPTFPSLGEDSILKPTLSWSLESGSAGKVQAEVAYLTQGFTWEASYNLVGAEKGDTLDMVGWITMVNTSGTAFKDAKVKLMAGEVNRVRQNERSVGKGFGAGIASSAPVVTEKAFDEFHLYSLSHPVTLRDKETKQVEFIRATGVKAERIYVFDGAGVRGTSDPYRSDRPPTAPLVQVYREFKNTKQNGLGIALPKGRLRFYAQAEDRQLEFVGENTIERTPRDERVRVLTGSSFDLVGERKQTNTLLPERGTRLESVEIKVRNRKKEPVVIHVVEHALYNVEWNLAEQSQASVKLDARTFEFLVPLQTDEEKTVTYTIKYVDW